jgi:hypothetical protein
MLRSNLPKKVPTRPKATAPSSGETHQQASRNGVLFTTNQGFPISDKEEFFEGGYVRPDAA